MQDYITRDIIEAAGITLAEDQVEDFLAHTNATLAERIGAEITESLTDEEVDEMLAVQESGDTNALQGWLVEHIPELGEIVQDEIDILLGELAESANSIESENLTSEPADSADEPVNPIDEPVNTEAPAAFDDESVGPESPVA